MCAGRVWQHLRPVDLQTPGGGRALWALKAEGAFSGSTRGARRGQETLWGPAENSSREAQEVPGDTRAGGCHTSNSRSARSSLDSLTPAENPKGPQLGAGLPGLGVTHVYPQPCPSNTETNPDRNKVSHRDKPSAQAGRPHLHTSWHTPQPHPLRPSHR